MIRQGKESKLDKLKFDIVMISGCAALIGLYICESAKKKVCHILGKKYHDKFNILNHDDRYEI